MLLTWLLLTTLQAPATGSAVLADGQSTARWSGGVKLVDGPTPGQHAVRYTVPRDGGVCGPNLDLKGVAGELAKTAELTFSYRFSGTGGSTLHLKVIDAAPSPRFRAGRRARRC